MTRTSADRPPEPNDIEDSFLRKQAWDYFSAHGAQRMTIFNFYIALSSLTATGYYASLKSDSHLESARTLFALLLCFFAFIFWKLDQRTKLLIKNAEHALKYFEELEPHPLHAKVFLCEETKTKATRKATKGWQSLMLWRQPLSYSDCFNLVYSVFFLIGAWSLLSNHPWWVQWCWHTIRSLV
jgi:hypothetical protein